MKKTLLLCALLAASLGFSQTFMPGSSNFGTSTGNRFLAFADLDHDGDMDAYSLNSSGHSIYLENTGTSQLPVFSLSPYDYDLTPSSTGMYFVDMDHDGDLDAWSVNALMLSTGTSFWLNKGNYAAPSFTNGQPVYGINGSFMGISFVDIDADQDMDAFAINTGTTTFWRNIGTATAPSFTMDSNFGLVASGTGIDFTDIDNDGDMDAFTIDSTVTYWRNTGTNFAPAFVASASNLGLNATGTGLSLVDIDHDGDVDAFSINATGGAAFWENVSLTTGIKTRVANHAAQCAPNPFSEKLRLSSTKEFNNATLVLHDVCGNVVMIVEHISGASVTLERNDLPGGLYSYRVSEGGVLLGSGRVVAE